MSPCRTDLITCSNFSKKCTAARHDDASDKHGMKAACFAFDVMAVKCFNDSSFQVHLDVSFTMRKLTCRAKVSLLLIPLLDS